MRNLESQSTDKAPTVGMYVGALAFLVGFLVVGIGTLSVVSDVFSGIVPPAMVMSYAVITTGSILALGLGLLVSVSGENSKSLSVTLGVGLTTCGVGLGMVSIVLLPASLENIGFIVASVLYTVGTFGLVLAIIGNISRSEYRTSHRQSFSYRRTDAWMQPPEVADGGDESELKFLLDEDDEDL